MLRPGKREALFIEWGVGAMQDEGCPGQRRPIPGAFAMKRRAWKAGGDKAGAEDLRALHAKILVGLEG